MLGITDSDKDSSPKERRDGSDDVGGGARASKVLGYSDKRKIHSKDKDLYGSGNGEYAEEHGSSKRRKEKVSDRVSDRWNGGSEEGLNKVKPSSKSKSRRRDEESEDVKSGKSAMHRESSRKEGTGRCNNSIDNEDITTGKGVAKECSEELNELHISAVPVKSLSSRFFLAKPEWDPKDSSQMSAVKEALHVSTLPPCTVVCREDEQERVLDFCKGCMEQDKAGSLYICGCPGTGKSLSMQKVKKLLLNWTQEASFQPPDVLELQCTSLVTTSEIFSKVLGKIHRTTKASTSSASALQLIKKLYSQEQQPHPRKMMLVIVDELDYLITRDRAVLHDLFMLTALPFSRCILIVLS